MNSRKRAAQILLVAFVIFSLLLSPISLSAYGFSEGSFTITLKSNPYELIKLDSGETEIKMKDFSDFTYPGKPALPSKVFKVLLPPLSNLKSIEVVHENKEDLGFGYKIVQAPFPVSDNGQVFYDDSDVDWSSVKNLGVKDLRKWRFVEIRFLPLSTLKVTDT
jgi:hypothetical protein